MKVNKQLKVNKQVNYNCHGEYWVDLEESVARAVRQVEHVVARGFTGALWYVGNEDGAQGGGIESVMPRSFHGPQGFQKCLWEL